MLLLIAEEFEKELSKLPALIRSIEQNSVIGSKECTKWLNEIIALSEKYYLPISAELAVIKGKTAVYSKPRNADRKESKNAFLKYFFEGLDSAREQIRGYFYNFNQTVSACESACLQTVSVIWASKMFGEVQPDAEMLWQISKKEPELLKAISQIVGMVGTANAKILLDRVIPQVYEKGKE